MNKSKEDVSTMNMNTIQTHPDNNASSPLPIPKKLYGRDDERKKVENIYTRVMGGENHLLLVGGYAGVGKTSVIQEFCRPVADFGGCFVSGKFEQLQKDTPYFAFIQAIRELVMIVLQQPDPLVKQWEERLLRALNGNGRLITDMVPELEFVIGQHPHLSDIGMAESRNRFLNTFYNFLKAFAWKNHPLTMFLDDLQWCDLPSMELIKYIMSQDDTEGLFIIACYRDNEILEDHPMYSHLEELKKLNKTVAISVKPLDEDHIVSILSDMLCHTAYSVGPLAKLVYKKTHGNPFFVRKLLLHLHSNNCICFNPQTMQWEWDTNKIEAIGISDNIIDFMSSQILTLPPEAQDLLKIAALVGNSFDSITLSAVAKISLPEVLARLKEAINYEIILPALSSNSAKAVSKTAEHNISFCFAHDRVQQACAKLMSKDKQNQLHLKIGRILKKNIPEKEWMDRAIDIVLHLNEGLEGITAHDERIQTAQMNLWACQKAEASSAFYSALHYISCAVSVLPKNSWDDEYDLTFDVIKKYIKCAYLNNEYAMAEEQADYLLDRVKIPIEQAQVRFIQGTLSNFQGQLDKAIKYCILGLKLLKMPILANPGMHLVLKDIISVKVGLLGRKVDSLLDLPPMKNEKIKLALSLYNEINRASYLYGDINLFLMSILKQMKLTLKYGSNRKSGLTYVSYAMILAVLGDYRGTYEFCELALKACEKEKCFECLPTILFSRGFFAHAWNSSWKDMEKWFERSMEEAIKFGDHHTIALAGTFMYAFKPDASIRILLEKSLKQFPLVKQTNNSMSINISFLMIHRWLNYAGLTDGQFTLNVSRQTYEKNCGIGIVYSEEECINAMREGNFMSAFGIYFNEKMYIHYLYDDYKGALEYMLESDKYLKQHEGTSYIVECRIYNFLVLSANIKAFGKKEADKALRRMKQEYNYIKTWAKHCACNFLHLKYIMEAEFARIAGKTYEAAELYDLAVHTARQNGFIRDEALANELAAKMYIERDKQKQGAFYMAESFRIYKLWGADAKVKNMAVKYGNLIKMAEDFGASQVTNNMNEDMELSTVIEAFRSLSKETKLSDLLRQIMKTIVEHSKAQKAYIILKSESGWIIEADNEENTEFMPITLEKGKDLLPSSVINFCIHTGEYVVLDDAQSSEDYRRDSYIIKNKIKSLLCIPILILDRLEGVLYLENNISANAFTKERINILQAIASQFSIAIKNVRLYEDLLAKTNEANTASEEALRSDIAFLQAQIKPHFLYNAINTISAFSLTDSNAARELLAKLSQYLRGSFDFKNRDRLVTLQKEIELVEAYLYIEKARFGDRLLVTYHIDESVDCLLPPLTIQPLVENAVLHGISTRKKGGLIEISVRGTNEFIIITVEDDGVGINEETCAKLFDDNHTETGGVALKNINRRLIRMYGKGLLIERKLHGGTRATIYIKK